jgi:ATP-dependent helicase HepA
VKAALFHEKLPLIQRDRQAAWFAEEDGARILLCSEIGSEGRNFQFVQHLVLFDLPWNPELLEQRIGRLDRIGQKGDINVHVPYAIGTPQEVLARWYHEGLNAFAENFSGVSQVQEHFDKGLRACVATPEKKRPQDQLLTKARAFRAALAERLESGRDRLLEIHSFRPESAHRVVAEIAAADGDATIDRFVTDCFDHFGLHLEELGQRTFNLGGGDLFKEKLPGLPAEGLTTTTERARALAREDVAFLSWEHPIVTSLLDMLLGSEAGNSSFVLWPNALVGGVLVEAIYVLDPAAPGELELDRWLPSTPIRIVLNHKRQELTAEISPDKLEGNLKNGTPGMLASQMQELESLVPGMIRVTEIIAGKRSKPIVEAAITGARTSLSAEIARLEHLRAGGAAVSQAELEALRQKLTRIEEKLQAPPIRLDALRFILASPAAKPPTSGTAAK